MDQTLCQHDLGGFYTTADGQTEDSAAKRLLFNIYNQGDRPVAKNDATVSWPLAKSASPGATGYSQARGIAANKICVFAARAGSPIKIDADGTFGPVSGGEFLVGIGLGSTTTSSHIKSKEGAGGSAYRVSASAKYRGFLALGYQEFIWLEQNFSDAGTTPTSYGTSSSGHLKTGLDGAVRL